VSGVSADQEPVLLNAAIPDRDCTVLPEGAKSWRLQAPSGSIAVMSLGNPSRPRVLLLPGATGSKEDFVLLAPLIAA
jgi:hypothetical protein